MKPSLRKPLGVLLLLLGLAVYAILAAEMLGWLVALPFWVQLPAYAAAGLLWLLPMKRYLQWMETGRWR